MKKMNLRKTTIASVTNSDLKLLKGGLILISYKCIPTVTLSRPTEHNVSIKTYNDGRL